MLSILSESRDWLSEVGPENPVLVVSCDGASRAGLYCALAYLADQAAREGELDIVSAVATVKANRPQLIDTQQEYALLHQLVGQLLEPAAPNGWQHFIRSMLKLFNNEIVSVKMTTSKKFKCF